MTETDVDMAIYAMGQAIEDLLAAARDAEARGHVAANHARLIEDINRLAEGLARIKPPAKARASVRRRRIDRFRPLTRPSSRVEVAEGRRS